MRGKPFLFLLLAVPLAAGPAPGEGAKADLKKMQGTWKMAALEVNGQQVPPGKLESATLTVRGDRYTVKVKDNVQETVIRLDPSARPRAIDMTFVGGANKDRVHKGIYEFSGDTLKICRGLNPDQERPNQFGTWPGTNVFLVTWKRVGD